MRRADDLLKCLRELCRTRKLQLEVRRTSSIVMVTIEAPTDFWGFSAGGSPHLAESFFSMAHAAVLAKFPPIAAKGGARHTKETRAAGRARLLAEQRAAREGR